MNALYRPGPMEYIPKFYCSASMEMEEIEYDLPEMEEFLSQGDLWNYCLSGASNACSLKSWQVLLKGDADVLRKAMGKKHESCPG